MEKSEEERRALIARRGAKKAALTRIKNKMDSTYVNDIEMLKLMIERAQEAFDGYEQLTLDVGDQEDPEPIETTYFECVAAMRNRIVELSGPGPTSSDARSVAPATPHVSSKLKLPNIEMQTFSESRALALENSEGRGDTASGAASKVAVAKAASSSFVTTKPSQDCLYCGKQHKLYACPKFSLASISERLEFVKETKLCKTCLNTHPGKCKFHFRCKECKENHNSLLHVNEEKPSVSLANVNNEPLVLLPTVKVKVISKSGKEIIVKAMLDCASQNSFVTAKLAKELGHPLSPGTTITGVTLNDKCIKHSLQLDIFSCVYPFKTNVKLLVVDKFTKEMLPQTKIDISKIKIPENITLADDSFHIPSKIDILLAANIFFQCLLSQPEELRDPDAAPSLVHTQFGYIVGGDVPSSILKRPAVTLFCQECQTDIRDTMSNFWHTEKVPEIYAEHTSEQQQCEKLFTETVKLEDNQFTVSLPLKIPIYDVNNTLGDSFGLALKRFYNLEKRFQKDQMLYDGYKDSYMNILI
ncbi:uncharacterized protein LOC125227000 [Leguminivora glycinivorella]|uniref:uncharacterized protein LOC125227000 n=1 Tax=Leguminivora glycinivorella TaxID=1035111 RepID=UPI00201029F5|nr:uncharacterized protein LOC125227000 [Leguminivora glycinivorella]